MGSEPLVMEVALINEGSIIVNRRCNIGNGRYTIRMGGKSVFTEDVILVMVNIPLITQELPLVTGQQGAFFW